MFSIRRSSASQLDVTDTLTKQANQYPCSDPCIVDGPTLLAHWSKPLSFAKTPSACDFNRIGVAIHRRSAIAPAHDERPWTPGGSDLWLIPISS